MKTTKRFLSALIALVVALSMLAVPMTVNAVEDLSGTVRFSDAWQAYSQALNKTSSAVLKYSVAMTGSTEFMLHSDDAFVDQKMLCVCDAGTGCEVLNGLKAENLKVRYDQNGEMLELTFADVEKVWDEKTHACVFATATPTVSAMADSVVTGAIWYESGEHKSGEFAFAFTLTGELATKSAARPSTSGGLQVKSGSDSAQSKNGSAGYVMGQSSGAAQLTGIVTQRAPQFKSLPAYTETISDTTDYANYGGSNWEVEPMTVEATIGPREKYTVALATSYWANADTSGYGAEPTQLVATFTSGDGMLDFYVTIGAGPIWGGAECEMLTIVPTDAAYALTADTTVTGTIDIYWRGYCHMPFSVTIDVEEQVAEEPKTEVICDSTATCGDDWSWTGDSDKIAALPAGEITADEIFVAAICTPYWTDNHYTTEAAETTVTFTSGAGLVTIALRNRQESVIWGGADCVFAEITPTETAEEIKEDTVVSGTFQMFYAPWGAYCEVPFEIVLKADVQNVEPDLPEYTETVSDSTDYANFGGSSWEVEPMTVETTIGPREKFSVALATSYWANPEASGYGAEPTKLNATFANGEGLLDFYVTIAAGPIWGGAECEMLTIVPTDAAYALTADTTITGTIEIYWRGWVQMPFSVTIDVPIEEGGETPEEPVAKTEVISDSTDACGDDWSWSGDGDKIAALPTGEITVEQIFVAAVCTPYWTDNYYTTEATPTTVTFTSGEGLVTIALRNRQESVIWGGADCVFAEATPTAAGEAITEATTVSGTFQMFYAPWGAYCEVPFEIVLKPVGSEGGEGGETPEEPVAKTEVISDSTDACGDDWSWSGDGDKIAALPTGEITVEQIFVAAVCTPYWTDNYYTTEATPTTVTFTSGEGLVTIALRNRQESVIWGGADCVFAEVTPTAAGEAITEATTVSGTFQMFYAPWGAYCEVPFEIVLKPVGSEGGEGGETPEEPAGKPEVISPSTDACGDDWSWSGEGDKIATLPYGEISVEETYVAAICSPYWTDNKYGTATAVNVTFTSGEGLVSIALHNRQESVIWGGAECVFAEITPTEAAANISRDMKVSGTFQMFYASWGSYCEVPFEILLKPAAGVETIDWTVADAWYQRAEEIISFADPKPLTHSFKIKDKTDGIKTLLHSSYHFTLCNCGDEDCDLTENVTNLKVRLDQGKDMATFQFEKIYYSDWGQDCTFMTITPTDAAKQAVRNGDITLTGAFYYEDGEHRSGDYVFNFTFTNGNLAPGEKEQRYLFDMPDQVNTAINDVIGGMSPTLLHWVIEEDGIYRGLFMRTTMRPFVPCTTCGMSCSEISNAGAANLKVKVTKNSHLADFSVEIAQYDGAAWGDCFYVTLTPTDAAVGVAPGTTIEGEFYLEVNGHKTSGFPFRYSFSVEEALPDKPEEIGTMADQVDAVLNILRTGGELKPIFAALQHDKSYRGLLMRQPMLPFVPCEIDDVYCQYTPNFTADNLKVKVNTNADLATFSVELAQYHGSAWGPCFYLNIRLTEAAKNAPKGTAITGEIYFEGDGHKTKAIPFAFFVEEVDGSKLTSTTVEAANNSELKKIEGMVDLVDAYVRETVEGKTPAPVSVVVDPNYEYVGMVMTKGLIPYVLCEKDGDKCAENANLGAEHMQVNFAENGNLIKDVRFEMANYDGWGDCVYMFVSFTDEAKQADPMTAIRGTLSFQKDGHKTKDIQLDMYLFDMPEDLKPQDAPEEQPTENVQQPTQEQQEQPGSNVGTNDPIDTVDDNGGDNLVLILVLCAAGLVLALALIVLLILVKKKNQK